MLAVLVIVCPPLAVLLTAPPSQALKNVGLTLLLYLPGVFHASAAVERYRARRQYAALMRVLDARVPVAPVPPSPPRTSRPAPTKSRRPATGPQAA
jgi:uncharacterized membrane protein YqaE (UPF0057 family)